MKISMSRWWFVALAAIMAAGCQKQEKEEVVTGYNTMQETVLTESEHASQETVLMEETTEAVNHETDKETGLAEETDSVRAVLDIHKMVGEAIIEQSRVMYPGYECAAEGHIILDTKEQDGILSVYAQTMYGEYQFHNEDYFVKSAGSGVIPCILEFLVNEKGAYKLYAVQWPEDGERYVQSIQEMFPENLWDTCISPSEEVREELKVQEQSYAESYVKKLGRTARIGDYADFDYILLTETGVSVEASNRMSEQEKYLPGYPDWVGSQELIEDGVRYVYLKKVDPQTGKVIFTKSEYQTGSVVESHEFDWQTGEKIRSEYEANTSTATATHDVMLTQAPVLKLQDMLSSIYHMFELQPGSYEWNYPENGQMVSVLACGADPREYVETKEKLTIPKYDRMEAVGYSVHSEKRPDTLVVKEYVTAALNDAAAEPVSVQNCEDVSMIRLKPNRYYEISAVWDERNLEKNGFYGSAEYALLTDR